MTKPHDLIIIGSGLAGSAAAVQAAQSGLNVLALSKPGDRGYWARVKHLSHFTGFSEGMSGTDYIGYMRKRAEAAGCAFKEFEVASIEPAETKSFRVAGNNGESHEGLALIIASGVTKDEHFLAGERELIGRGVFYSVENEAPGLKHHSTTIVGRTEEAAAAALYLTRFTEKIFFVIPGSKLDVPETIFKELEGNKKIELLFSSSIKKLSGNDGLHSVIILSAGAERELKTSSAFIYTYNLQPRTSFAKTAVETDEKSERVLIDPDFSTSRPGIFACGDVLAGTLQNPIISVAQGTIAAMNVEKFLSGSPLSRG